ncbi:MAG: 16S rRNA (cytosine(1402)-N(4))-methyltransferase RsmH, partial [Chloroflexi bacterium]|nr:16S rRNA (cytosine(1402)-N(4))-methyltransferase RsmH [Chloroflexota bacterium]
QAILDRCGPDGRLLGLDADPQALQAAGERLRAYGERVTLVHANYGQLGDVAPAQGFAPADGVLLDLGLSSRQLADPARGFSFQGDGPLDMRLDPRQTDTAADLVNHAAPDELQRIIAEYGEERQARRITQAIAASRPLHTTAELVQVIDRATGGRRGQRIHPATRTFQALRIAVNDELGNLERGLNAAIDLLAPGGRLAVIAFHSLEDRLVKHTLQRESRDCICPPRAPVCTCGHQARLALLTRKPIRPTPAEVARNPRSRSARLRAARKLGTP